MSVAFSNSLSKLNLPQLQAETALDRAVADGEHSQLVDTLLEVIEQRRELLFDQLNDLSRSVMLATAAGAFLDQAAALLGVRRMTITPADPKANPPQPAVMESDERLRLRARLSMQAMSHAGCKGSYRFCALSASAHVKDVSVFTRDEQASADVVNVVILGDSGRGDGMSTADDIPGTVERAVGNVASITDHIKVRWATIVDYRVDAKLQIDEHANKPDVIAAAAAAVKRLVRDNHRLGKNIVRDEFLSALYQPGVEQVLLIEPAVDQAVPIDAAAYNAGDSNDAATFNIEAVQTLTLVNEQHLQSTVRGLRLVRMNTQLERPAQ